MMGCSAWEIWRIRRHIVDTVLIVNLTPLEGIPYLHGKPDTRVSIFLAEEDLLECTGTLSDEEMACVTRNYLRTRKITSS